jgi:threonine dehydratase
MSAILDSPTLPGRVMAARARIQPYIHKTPLLHSSTLSSMTGRQIYLKAELFQKTGSFKVRGFLNRLMLLSDEERRQGVITFSAGNASQGLAYAARITGVPTTVAMPATASPMKVEATRQYGAEVILHGTPKECLGFCLETARERGLLYLSSFDDLDLMIGHASLGLEILEQLSDVAAIYVGVGGGGTIGGLTIALQVCGASAKLIGVEPAGAPTMTESLRQGRAVSLDEVNTIADGLACPIAGTLCFELVRARSSSIIIVNDAQIIEAMKLLMLRSKLLAEPAGAASLAGLLSETERTPPGANVVCVISGGNIDLSKLKALI